MADQNLKRMLIIEDDEDTRANIADILELDGYACDSAATLGDGMRRLRENEYFAIVLDRKLPDGHATDALPTFRRLAPKSAVIVVTGYADLDGAIVALREGASDYILKPINADALRASLTRIRQKQAAAEEIARLSRLAAIGETMAALVHESRNALQRSKACLEMLAEEVHDRPRALELVVRTQRAQERLAQLYEEVRQYAAPIQLKIERHALASIWREAWEHLTHVHQEKSLRLVETGGATDTACEVDRLRVSQVMLNVLENAVQASPSGAQIKIECNLSQLAERPALEVTIIDQGPGLALEQRRHIFEPFYTTKSKGTGLGMAIVQRIVQAHGGKVAVAEQNGPGAKIVVTLPRERA
jgi:signal transduction histidine kinase